LPSGVRPTKKPSTVIEATQAAPPLAPSELVPSPSSLEFVVAPGRDAVVDVWRAAEVLADGGPLDVALPSQTASYRFSPRHETEPSGARAPAPATRHT